MALWMSWLALLAWGFFRDDDENVGGRGKLLVRSGRGDYFGFDMCYLGVEGAWEVDELLPDFIVIL